MSKVYHYSNMFSQSPDHPYIFHIKHFALFRFCYYRGSEADKNCKAHQGQNTAYAEDGRIGTYRRFIVCSRPEGRPAMIVDDSTKGEGVSFYENKVKYHGVAPSGEELKMELKEINDAEPVKTSLKT